MNKYRILVVDDEEDLCEILKFNLENEDFVVDVAYSAEEALKANIEKYDLLLLDVMMGKMSGFKLAEKVRKEKELSVPIIFLTAKDTENETLTGFSLGADDYISKPFSVRQLLARVKAVLKRSRPIEDIEENISVKNIEIDVSEKSVKVDGKYVNLAKKEFEILRLLLNQQNKVFSREKIMSKVWGSEVVVCDRTIDVHIARIRKKLGKHGKSLVNKSGYGYCFNEDNM